MASSNRLPSFDPNESLEVALEILKVAASHFALIGRVATWVYLESDLHQFTKDVDIAVYFHEIAAIEQEIQRRELNYHPLQIGGIGIRDAQVNIDFIDRHELGIDRLYREAIEQSRTQIQVSHQTVPVVRLEHLIAMKMVSGEPKDDQDVKALLGVKDLHYTQCREIVERFLGSIVATRLDVFAREVGLLPKRGPYQDSDHQGKRKR